MARAVPGTESGVLAEVRGISRILMMASGLNMFNQVSNYYRDVIWGGVLILVLVFNRLFSTRAARRTSRKRAIA